jgi:hypothetical protein
MAEENHCGASGSHLDCRADAKLKCYPKIRNTAATIAKTMMQLTIAKAVNNSFKRSRHRARASRPSGEGADAEAGGS